MRSVLTHLNAPWRAASVLAALLISASTVAAQSTPATQPAAAARAATPRPAAPAERIEGAGPNGATLRCRDGSYPAVGAPDSACEGKGGILVRFPIRRFPVAAPAPSVVAAPPLAAAPVDTATAAALREPPMTSRAKEFIPAPRPPANATLQCQDGTFVVSDTSATRCATRGGVLVRFPPPVRRIPR
ncbi:MAG: hypothetical protein IT357_03360 [Gemmatimonadaceae bacterium]|nr:hypothetical protein [Gemmatimonadaceae bacterium]